MYGEENPLALGGVLSLLCSNKGSNTTKTMSVNITDIGMHDGLHHPPWPHLELSIFFQIFLILFDNILMVLTCTHFAVLTVTFDFDPTTQNHHRRLVYCSLIRSEIEKNKIYFRFIWPIN